MSDKNEMHRDIMNLCCNELHAASPNELEQAAYGSGFRDARHQAAELVLAAKESSSKELELMTISRDAALSQSKLWHGLINDIWEVVRYCGGAGEKDSVRNVKIVLTELEAAKQTASSATFDLLSVKKDLFQCQAEKEALEKKLAEQQAHTEKMRDVLLKAFQKITCYSGLEVCGDIEEVVNGIGTSEELTKREAAARQQGFEEGKLSGAGGEELMTLRAQLTESQRQLGEAQSQNNFDATRLRRLCAHFGLGDAVPVSDEELLQVAGTVIGSVLRVAEKNRADDRQAGRDELQEEIASLKAQLAEAQNKTDLLCDSSYIAGMKFGWNCAETSDQKQFTAAIESRINERSAAPTYKKED